MGLLGSTVLVVLLAALCSGEGELEIWKSLSTRAIGGLEEEPCHQPGWRCNSCTSREFCAPKYLGYDVDIRKDCPDERPHCDFVSGECVPELSDARICPLDEGFKCKAPGLFPDAFNCNVFFRCAVSTSGELEATVHVCPAGQAFVSSNEEDGGCSGKIEDNLNCPLQNPCKDGTETKVGAWKDNPNIYYVCRQRDEEDPDSHFDVPVLYKCMEGKGYIFKEDDHICEPPPPPPGPDAEHVDERGSNTAGEPGDGPVKKAGE